jgi:hypothetical protein
MDKMKVKAAEMRARGTFGGELAGTRVRWVSKRGDDAGSRTDGED